MAVTSLMSKMAFAKHEALRLSVWSTTEKSRTGFTDGKPDIIKMLKISRC
jgi:hypothetical protein